MEMLDENELNRVSGGIATDGPFFSYIVRDGETLGKIAFRFGTSVGVLMRINDLKAGDVKPGVSLLIPQN